MREVFIRLKMAVARGAANQDGCEPPQPSL